MAQITYANKVALNENPEIADINKVKDTDMNQIKDVVNQNDTKLLVAVSSAAPDTCSTGDVYFNSTDNLLYAAIATNTWGSAGLVPTFNTIYAVISDRELYLFNGTTLVKVSGNSDFEPIGKVVPMALETAPDGYLLCDGSTYTKSAYPDLYNALVGTQFIIDTNTFSVPNIKGRVIVGKDSTQTEFDTIGETGGSKELQEHSHQIKGFRNTINGTGETIPVASFRNSDDDADGAYTRTAGTGNSGNLQPYTTLNYFIKAQKLSGDVVLSESLPAGTVVDFDGSASDIPVGWEAYGTGQIKKVAPTTSLPAQVVNTYSNSDKDTYACNYINGINTYSTNEVDTGKKWIDGSKIYSKAYTGNLPAGTDDRNLISLASNINVINVWGKAKNTTSNLTVFVNNAYTNWKFFVYVNAENEIITQIGSNLVNQPYEIVIEYTKTTDNSNTRNIQENKKSIGEDNKGEEEPIENKK